MIGLGLARAPPSGPPLSWNDATRLRGPTTNDLNKDRKLPAHIDQHMFRAAQTKLSGIMAKTRSGETICTGSSPSRPAVEEQLDLPWQWSIGQVDENPQPGCGGEEVRGQGAVSRNSAMVR